jgi:hypothetical protein
MECPVRLTDETDELDLSVVVGLPIFSQAKTNRQQQIPDPILSILSHGRDWASWSSEASNGIMGKQAQDQHRKGWNEDGPAIDT